MQTLINRSAPAPNYSKANFHAEQVAQNPTVGCEPAKQTLSTIDVWKIRSMSKPVARRQHRFIN
ncbi:MAG: hypothetical protein ABJA76_22930 [Mucilaginibacter sp.]